MRTDMLERTRTGDVACHTDPRLRRGHGVVVAFSERTGGLSVPPYASLNLASHVGDDAGLVDANRTILLEALGIPELRGALTMAEQVHGTRIAQVTADMAGQGAWAREEKAGPVPATDALWTLEEGVPLMLCFADCVPVILVATGPVRAVAVVHAGWRGALGRLPGLAAERLSRAAGCSTSELLAYVGPHIGAGSYEVDPSLLSQFTDAFGSIAAAQGRLDLGAVVSETLNEVGVPFSSRFRVGSRTADRTDEFFSHRAEGRTGRHGAVVCILGGPQ